VLHFILNYVTAVKGL